MESRVRSALAVTFLALPPLIVGVAWLTSYLRRDNVGWYVRNDHWMISSDRGEVDLYHTANPSRPMAVGHRGWSLSDADRSAKRDGQTFLGFRRLRPVPQITLYLTNAYGVPYWF